MAPVFCLSETLVNGKWEMSSADVSIVGSGPAGTAAAIQCAQAGLRVVLIDREPFPRERPGETLHPGIEPLLRQLGVSERILSAGFLRHDGNWVQWEGDSRFMRFGSDHSGQWHGFQAWRADFDAILLNRARELGVQVLQPRRALQPIVSGGRVVGVVTSQGPLRSSFLIDAAGGQHWLARQLGLKVTEYSPPLVASFGYGEGECCIRDDAPAIVADKLGWTWTARVRPRLYQWTRLAFEHKTLDEDWVPPEFERLKPRGRTRGADVTWRIVKETAGPGYFIVGDAAAVLDPAASHGVLKAVMSGILAGHCITRVLWYGHPEATATRAYRQWLSDWFKHDVTGLKKLYSGLPNPPAWVSV